MKILDKIGLILFSNLILILCIIICLLIFGWITPDNVYYAINLVLNNQIASNIILTLSVIFILLALKCIFFTSEEKKINGIRDGILLENDDGQLVISKSTLEELVNKIAIGFESAENVTTKVVLDEEKKLIVYVTLSVKEDAVIKELSSNLQNKIKDAIKKTSDLEVKEVNISVKDLSQKQNNTAIE